MTSGGLRALPILAKTILQILFNSYDNMQSMVFHKTKRVNVPAAIGTHDNRISMNPMEETKTMFQVLCSSHDNMYNMVSL